MDGAFTIAMLAALGGGVSLFMLLRAAFAGPDARLRKRLARVRDHGRPAPAGEGNTTLRRSEESGLIPGLDLLVKWLLPRPALLR